MDNMLIIYSFARSGGTLVNQMLGMHPQCLVLSEVNSAASCKPIVEQAFQWLDLVNAKESIEFSSKSYSQQIRILNERAKKKGKKLIIRDWVTVNFLPGCLGEQIKPSGILEQQQYLQHIGLTPISLVVSRRGALVYESIKKSFPSLIDFNLNIFAESYLYFAQAVSNYPVIHLEDLQTKPESTLIEILILFNLDTSLASEIIDTFYKYNKCTGNNTLAKPSPSSKASKILPVDMLLLQECLKKHAHPLIDEADRLLGYE